MAARIYLEYFAGLRRISARLEFVQNGSAAVTVNYFERSYACAGAILTL